MTEQQTFTRVFIESQMKTFQLNLDRARIEYKRSTIANAYTAGRIEYNRHAVAACKFMLDQLKHYASTPDIDSPKRKAR